MEKQRVQETATDLMTSLNITPAQEMIKIVTQHTTRDKNTRRFMDAQLHEIRRKLIRDDRLWTVATMTVTDTNGNEEEDPGKDQAVRHLLKAMKAYGEEDELSAEDFHKIWTGETAEESFGPTASTLMN
jgi:hypothetical protein